MHGEGGEVEGRGEFKCSPALALSEIITLQPFLFFVPLWYLIKKNCAQAVDCFKAFETALRVSNSVKWLQKYDPPPPCQIGLFGKDVYVDKQC